MVLPLKIDSRTLSFNNGIYAMVLVDLDLSKMLLEHILVKRKGLSFFVYVSYEKLPALCFNCGCIRHNLRECRRRGLQQYNGTKVEGGRIAQQ